MESLLEVGQIVNTYGSWDTPKTYIGKLSSTIHLNALLFSHMLS